MFKIDVRTDVSLYVHLISLLRITIMMIMILPRNLPYITVKVFRISNFKHSFVLYRLDGYKCTN